MHIHKSKKKTKGTKYKAKENDIIYVHKIRFKITTCKNFEDTIRRGRQVYLGLTRDE